MPKKGENHSIEAKKKISRVMVERWKNPEYRKMKLETMKGSTHPNWKGGEILSHGYIIVYHPKHPFCDSSGYVLRSHLVMEKMIGRCLKPGEIVHHKGINFPISSAENKLDDSPENLELFTNANEHAKFHNPQKRIFRKCPNCGKSFDTIHSHNRKYCRQKCYWEYMKGKSWHFALQV